MHASNILFGSPTSVPLISLLPDFQKIIDVGLSDGSPATLGMEAPASVDAVLFIGGLIVNCSAPDLEEGPRLHDILQRLSLLSANIPFASLRYQAHLLTSNILRRRVTTSARLGFIKDTLEHCPYENLKASAVGWLKEEILETSNDAKDLDVSPLSSNVLSPFSPLLLVDPLALVNDGRSDERRTNSPENLSLFLAHQSFVLAVLNLLYLLLSNATLFRTFGVRSQGPNFDVIGYCDRMRAASLLFQGYLAEMSKDQQGSDPTSKFQMDEEEIATSTAALLLLDQTIDRVMEAAGKVELGKQ